jgi:hypothetical protein
MTEALENEQVMSIGDFIKITSQDPEVNSVWKVEYISPEKIILLKVVDGEEKTITYTIEDGVIQDDRIENIELLEKEVQQNTAYSIQRELFADKWIEVIFQGLDEPIVGKIAKQIDDSIEVNIYENGELMEDPFVLDFNYAGLPEGVLSIIIIKDPTTDITPIDEPDPFQAKEKEQESEYSVGEDVSIQILEERDQRKFRYGLVEQTNDLLESLLAKVPLNNQTDEKILTKINKMILRFKQLRELFSTFDENKNIKYYSDKKEAINWHGENWKPLKKTANNIGWILPIAKNTKKIYNIGDENDYNDVIHKEMSISKDINKLKEEIDAYEEGQIAYTTLYKNISSNLVPFNAPNDLTNTFPQKVTKDMDMLVGNNDNLSNTYNNNKIKPMIFQLNRYTSGIDYIQQHKLTKDIMSTSFHSLIPEDNAYIGAMLTLPSPFFEYSKVKLAGTDALTRANLGCTIPIFSKLLTNKTPITSLKIDNIRAPLEPDREFIGKFFKEYSYIGDQNVSYDQFLDYFIPTTSTIIENNKNKFSYKHLSLSSILNELEPYSIYPSDLTVSHYNMIHTAIKGNFKHYSTKLKTNKSSFNELTTSLAYLNKYRGTTLIPITEEMKEVQNDYLVHKYFELIPNKNIVSSEILSQMLNLDNARLFHSYCADSSVELLSKTKDIELDIIDEDVEVPENKCVSYVVSNKYNTIAELESDNGKELFFGESLKPVVDGYYAIVKETAAAYKRQNNMWVLDESAPKNVLDQTGMCNSQPDCIENNNVCTSLSEVKMKIEDKILLDRNNAEIKIKESMQKYRDILWDEVFQDITNIQFSVASLERRANRLKYKMGLELQQTEIVTSPFAKYVDMIIAHPSFEERQNLIIKFCSNKDICRQAELEEDVHWLYCSKTNTKLIPSFFYELATAYKVGRYDQQMEIVLNERRAVDDNGVIWIDKYSGYAIKHIDFDTDEGYTESGFKNVSRGVIEDTTDPDIEMMMEENAETKVEVKKRIEYDAEGRYIYGVIETLSNHMKIDIKNTFGFIIQTVTQIYNKPDLIMPQKIYMAQKTTKPYEEYLKTQLTYITLAVYLIVCQTRIPTIVPKGTFPGCVKSFSGYPVGNSDDMSSVIYLYCILNKTKFVSISSKPENLNKYIDLAMQDFGIRSIVYRKRNARDAPPVVSSEHSIFKWTSFLPALVSFKLTRVLNVHEDFKDRLIEDIQTGNVSQHEKIDVLKSKIILFSYAIQQEIQKIVENENLILRTSENKSLNENACCNLETINISTLTYFKNKTDLIETYNNAIMGHAILLKGVDTITKTVMWLSAEKTKIQPVQTVVDFSEQTIYAGIIKHCQFRTNLSTSQQLIDIYGTKPENIKITDTNDDIIVKLKRDGVEYTNDQLIKVLTLVSKAVEYIDLSDKENSVLDAVLTFIKDLDTDEKDEQMPVIQFEFKDKIEQSLKDGSVNELTRYVFNQNYRIVEDMKPLLKMKEPFQYFLNGPRTQVNFQFLKNSIVNMGSVFPHMCITGKSHYKERLPSFWKLSSTHNDELVKMYERIFEKIVFYNKTKYVGFFKYIIETNSKVVEMVHKIPFMENEIGFLVLEHCLLLVFNTYMTTGVNQINDGTDIYENTLNRVGVVNKIQCGILKDFITVLIGQNNAVNISYETIEDKVFRLKEKEKNKLLEKLNATKDLAIDNHFKTLRIGERWGMGSNVRGYDKDRFDKERREFVLDGNEMDAIAEEQNGFDADMDGAEYDDIDYQNDFDNVEDE